MALDRCQAAWTTQTGVPPPRPTHLPLRISWSGSAKAVANRAEDGVSFEDPGHNEPNEPDAFYDGRDLE